MTPNPEPVKLCKDCRHFILAGAGIQYSACRVSFENIEYTGRLDLVSDNIPAARKYCSMSRAFGPCTPSAKLFEPKCGDGA